MKMFKCCRTCMDNLSRIAEGKFKLGKSADVFPVCPLKPTCHGQPERMKLEEPLIEKIDDNQFEHAFKICRTDMPCSEHGGNT